MDYCFILFVSLCMNIKRRIYGISDKIKSLKNKPQEHVCYRKYAAFLGVRTKTASRNNTCRPQTPIEAWRKKKFFSSYRGY